VAGYSPGGCSVNLAQVPELTFCAGGRVPKERAATENVSATPVGLVDVRLKNFRDGPSFHVEVFGTNYLKTLDTRPTRRERLNVDEESTSVECSCGFYKVPVRIDKNSDPTETGRYRRTIDLFTFEVRKPSDTTFAEKEGAALAGLYSLRKSKYKTPNEEPKKKVFPGRG